MMGNTGQSCNAPSRMLVAGLGLRSSSRHCPSGVAEQVPVDQPSTEGQHIGPLSSRVQFDKVQGLIAQGIDEGAQIGCWRAWQTRGF